MSMIQPRRALVVITCIFASFVSAAASPASSPARRWTVEDFDAVLFVGLEGFRDFENGRRAFARGTCGACHLFAKQGRRDGADLTGPALQLPPRDLLAKVLSPEHSARPGKDGAGSIGEILGKLDEADILDLLAFLLSGGDGKDAIFAN